MATLTTPATTMKMVGAGSQYAWGDRDSSGAYLDGGTSYRLTLPPNVPAKNSWSVVVYDPQTQSELQTRQPCPSKNNQSGDLAQNPDGSIDLYFGPEAPRGTRIELDADSAQEGLVHSPSPLRTTRGVVRPDVATR